MTRLIKIKEIKNVRYFDKGKRSLIFVGHYKKYKVAIKLEKPNITSNNRSKHESSVLKLVNKYGIGPKLLSYGKNYLVYDFVKGKKIVDWIKLNKRDEIKKCLKNILFQCYILDNLGLNKKELNRPLKHILVKDGRPVMIDFERTVNTKHPKNVTQFFQFLMSKTVNEALNERELFVNRNIILTLLKIYKRNINEKNFNELLKILD